MRQVATYQVNNKTYKGSFSFPKGEGKRAAVLLFHAAEGRSEWNCQQADRLAEEGYVAFAADMYGDAKVFTTMEGFMEGMTPFLQDRHLLKQVATAALKTVQANPRVDCDKVAAIGFCFGGMCVLDLARHGADLKAVIPIHGVFKPSSMDAPFRAKVLALSGAQDPQVTEKDRHAFGKEMSEAGVDWQLHLFGDAKHSFTDPDAEKIGDPALGRVYNKRATERTWRLVLDFLKEVFLSS